jgi:hypothetical protein
MNPLYTLRLQNNIFPSKYSISLETLKFKSNKKYNLFINSQSISIDSIILPISQKINDGIFRIVSDIGTIWEINISLLKKMCKTCVYNDKIYIQLLHNIKNNSNMNSIICDNNLEMPMFSNKFDKIYLELDSVLEFEYDIIFKKKYYIGTTYIKVENFIYTLYQYRGVNINYPNNIEKKGAFIGLYIDINIPINRLLLFVNNIAVLEYNKLVTPHYDNLIYRNIIWSLECIKYY